MILVDKTGHLVSDKSWSELHKFAKKIGLKREWFQNKSRYPHYDLTTKRMIQKAIRNGASHVTSRKLFVSVMESGLWDSLNIDRTNGLNPAE